MSTEKYRYYRFDGDRQIHSVEWVYAGNDGEAIAHVGAKHPNSSCEVWQGRRLVAKLSSPFDPDDPQLQNAVGERLSALAQNIKLGLED